MGPRTSGSVALVDDHLTFSTVPTDEPIRIDYGERFRVAKQRTSRPGLLGTCLIAAAITGVAAYLQDRPTEAKVFAAIVGAVLGYLAAWLVLVAYWFLRSPRLILENRLRACEKALADSKARQVTPSDFELEREFETQLHTARKALRIFTKLVNEAFDTYRRELPPDRPRNWKDYLPEDPGELDPHLEAFAEGLARGGSYFGSWREQKEPQYNEARTDLDSFYRYVNNRRKNFPDFYEKKIVPDVKAQQYDVLHLCTYLNRALAVQVHSSDYTPQSPPWQELWQDWSADPPLHKVPESYG